MTINEEVVNDTVVLNVSGHVDTVSSKDLQSSILLAFQKMPNVTVDFSEVDYISSAGLRALLIGEKTSKAKGGSFIIRNTNDAVNEVFKVTGFDSLFTIV